MLRGPSKTSIILYMRYAAGFSFSTDELEGLVRKTGGQDSAGTGSLSHLRAFKILYFALFDRLPKDEKLTDYESCMTDDVMLLCVTHPGG